MMEKMKFETKDLTQGNIAKIGQLFPEVLTETKDENGTLKKAIDFDKLRQILSDSAIDNRETYDFTWVGKKQAILEAATPIRKTLRPCKEESVNWDTTQNLYIEGDNLDVLKLLQESYLGKVKMIYIDPPYNTGNDFIYRDDFAMSQEEYEESGERIDESGNRLVKNTDSNGRFHSDWCSMMYPRLKLARNLLTDDGVIFISIDDNEVENLRKICDEVFGEENFISMPIRRKNKLVMKGDKTFKNVIEPLIVYAKIKKNLFFQYTGPESLSDFSVISAGYGIKTIEFQPNELNFRSKSGYVKKGRYDSLLLHNDITIENNRNKNCVRIDAEFKWSDEKIHEKLSTNAHILIKDIKSMTPRIYFQTNTSKPLDYVDEKYGKVTNEAGIQNLKELDLDKYFDYPKPIDYIHFLINISNNKNAIVLDFFSGSATTAHAVMKLNAEDGGNRKFIMIQLPEECDKTSEAYKAGYKNICGIGKERIRRAAKQIKEEHPESNFDGGFRVFKLAGSNMKDIYFSPNEYRQDFLDKMTSNIKEDRNDMDLLYGCMLEWGLPLSYPHTSEKVGSYTVHTVNNGDLMACFDENITEDIIRHIAAKKPLRVVFRDAGFTDSPAKINVGELFKLISPDTKVKVI